MKQFLIVLKFEIQTMMSKKSFRVSSILVAVMLFVGFSIPRFSDAFSNKSSDTGEKEIIEIIDPNDILVDYVLAETMFANYDIRYHDSIDLMEANVIAGDVAYGFEIIDQTNYRSYVNNSSLYDQDSALFKEVLAKQYQLTMLGEKGYDATEIEAIYSTPIMQQMEVLGKDGVSNYFYTYAFIMMIYIMILVYGNQIGVGVASEKSNRAIEILVTSCSSNALIFGKVIAGAITGFIQTVIILGSAVLAYQINVDAWDHALDAFFNIPVDVVVIFGVFGILGYLLYSFLFGAIGAVVSKVEEVNGATLPIQLVVIACFLVAAITLQTPDSTLSIVASYFPFSSCMCMFIRVALGSATMIEVVISALILLVSTIALGLLGAKLYRRGTLSYGNNIKYSTMLKMIKQKD